VATASARRTAASARPSLGASYGGFRPGLGGYAAPASTYAAPIRSAIPASPYGNLSYSRPAAYGGAPLTTSTYGYGAPRVYGGAAAAKPKFKVCVCGGAGGIGQPLSLLMSMSDLVGELSVQDVTMAMVPAAGVAADLGHLEKNCKVSPYAIDPKLPAVDQLEDCLTGCHLVLVPAGVPRKPGMTRDDLFGINAGIAKGIVEACATYCPDAILALIVNPVNSIVPAMAELYKKMGLDPKKIVGVTTLDCVRANKFVAEKLGCDATKVSIPVVGGHAGTTILPLFSQDAYGRKLSQEDVEALDKRTQDAGTEVVNAKDGKGSATLSMAYAGARLGKAVLAGLAGKPTTECAYVCSEGVSDLPYFSTKVTFGRTGVEAVHPIGQITEYEMGRLQEASDQLATEIQTGLDYAAAQ